MGVVRLRGDDEGGEVIKEGSVDDMDMKGKGRMGDKVK